MSRVEPVSPIPGVPAMARRSAGFRSRKEVMKQRSSLGPAASVTPDPRDLEWPSLSEYARACLSGAPPPCAAACPLGLDVLGIIAKLKSGLWPAAAKMVRGLTVFPGIVSHLCAEPCGQDCLRAEAGDAIRLKDIEKWLWSRMRRKKNPTYFIPPQHKKILIVGAGLRGLSCALKLAGRGFAVQVVEKSGALGGRLLELDPDLIPVEVIEEDFAPLQQHKFLSITINTEVASLSGYEFDAALLAFDGAAAEYPKLAASAAGRTDVFFQPESIAGQYDPIQSIGQGLEWTYILEDCARLGRADIRPKATPAAVKPSTCGAASVFSDWPAEPEEADARREAERCLECSCRQCLDSCDMLRYFHFDPKQVLRNVSGSLNKLEFTKRPGMKQIRSCTGCGRCQTACPAGINFKEVFLSSRRILHQGGHLPLAAYDYWLNDLEFAGGPEAAFKYTPQPKPNFLYFPGCQLGASDPGYVLGSYGRLVSQVDPDMAIMLQCCGAPAYWAGDNKLQRRVLDDIRLYWQVLDRPEVLVACSTCLDIFRQHLPELNCHSLWPVLAENEPDDTPDRGSLSVFDPCASRSAPESQAAIRKLAVKMGFKVNELPDHGPRARCCGYGGLIQSSNLELAAVMVGSNLVQGDNDFLTYCSNCRDSFALHGKRAPHVLDLLLFPDEDRSLRPPPDLSQRRENRRRLKSDLGLRLTGRKPASNAPAPPRPTLQFSPEIRRQMNADLILDENVGAVIERAEKEGYKLLDSATGWFTAHLCIGNLTFWVQYGLEGGEYVVHKVYKHKMKIEEPGQ